MLDLKYIRENKETILENCKNRGVSVDLESLLEADEERRKLLKKIEDLRGVRKQKSKQKPDEEGIMLMRKLGVEVQQLERILEKKEDEMKEWWYKIPNLTHPDSPVGGEEDFKVLHINKEPVEFNFKPKDHEELMLNLDLIDFERGAKVTGSKFYFFKNQMIKLNQALINYGLDIAVKHGYVPMETPDLVNEEIMEGSGFNPRGEEKQTYEIEEDELDLIGTAEITILGYHSNETLDLTVGPKKYVALSHCFRKEAGTYGHASKGLYRVHQFSKLEMFIFCKPEDSEKHHLELLSIEKEIADGLGFPYRVIDIATGDLGGPAYRKYDLEAFMTMKGDEEKQGDYGEITSTSNCTDYQARRLNIKDKDEDGNTKFVHTLNGTAVVLSRFPIAIIENNQQADGSIAMPEILRKYCGFDKITKN
jgi:seryl-tRNA synthetase